MYLNNSGKKNFQDEEIYEHNVYRPCSSQEKVINA